MYLMYLIYIFNRQTNNINKLILFRRKVSQLTEFNMAAKEVLNDIVQSVQNSKLNFSVNLTPFSAYITIRSSFVKNYSPPPATIPQCVSQTNVEADYQVLIKKHDQLLQQIKDLEETNRACTNTVKILEEKVSKLEASAFKFFEEKSLEINCLKKALKAKDSEVACF